MSNEQGEVMQFDKKDYLEGFSEEEGNLKIDALTGLAAVALNLALKYYGINTVQDGALYQQYKLEGRNMQSLHLEMVFETAIQIERHFASAPKRLLSAMFDQLENQEPDGDGGLDDEVTTPDASTP